MAKKKGTIDVSGISISDIMNIDINTFNKLGESDLRRITSRLVSAGNKRIRRLESAGITSPAYSSLGTSGNKFSTKLPKGISETQRVNALRQEFSRTRGFLSMKTSTISGYNEYIKEMKEEISESTGLSKKDLKGVDLGKAFATLHKLQQSGKIPVNNTGTKGGSKGSIHARNYIISQMVENPTISEEDLMKDTQEDYNDYYDETEETEL